MQKLTLTLTIVLLTVLTACSSLGGDANSTKNILVDVASEPEMQGLQSSDSAQVGGVAQTSAPTMSAQRANTSENVVALAPAPVVEADGIDVAMQMPNQVEDVDDDLDMEASEEESVDTMLFEDYGVNPFVETSQDNLSTFAMDVDTGSYTLARSYLTQYSQMPPPESIRAEEFINYIPPHYDAPQGDDAFAINLDASRSPFSADNQYLVRVGIQGRVVAPEDRDPALLIFVVDVSGSMDQTNRLELAKDALEILVGELREDDRVGIVIYADQARVILEPTPASEQRRIIRAIDSLQTSGSTYAEAGLALAYEMALTHMRGGQTNRVILVSDGVANVGATGPDAILQTVTQGVESGITLSTIGVGMGNFNDVMMEQLANDGNGNYHYVDTLREARRIFVNNLTSTLQVIGYDAKIQVEFNPDTIAQYRLIGYENREVADQDFRNDDVDAGEVGAGHTITALYEIELHENVSIDDLATVYVRYQDADSEDIVEINQTLTGEMLQSDFSDMPIDFQLTATTAEFSEMLRQSPYGDSSYDDLLTILRLFTANDPIASELMTLIQSAQQLG